nr:MAG TPA: hypothetical protein [Caudoviricetes sp.]
MRVNLRLLSHSGDGVRIVTMPKLTLRADDSAECTSLLRRKLFEC